MRRIALLSLLAALLLPSAAAAAPVTKTFRYGPIKVGPYEVKQNNFSIDVPTPAVDGYITAMDTDVVDANGKPVPISRLMLHHIVFLNLGEKIGDKRDGTCNGFTALDSRTQLPGLAERFYGAGEERQRLRMPPGYGYRIKKRDRWALTWMFMNHRNKIDSAYIQYRITYDTAPLKPAKPYWLDVKNCLSDPVYTVAGGRKRGSVSSRSTTWTVPDSGRIVSGGGHAHGGARSLDLARANCTLYRSKPTWGFKSDPFYNVRPVLHEPGPRNMTGFTSAQGFAVQRGERLRLRSRYDSERLHSRVMGIMVVFLAKDASVKPTRSCKRPRDLRDFRGQNGRTKPPRFTVPLNGLGSDGKAREIAKPPGKRVRLASGSVIEVRDRFFAKPNVSVRSGAVLRWRFEGSELHNVTVASGPRGFSSAHKDLGRTYSQRLTTPGNYKLYCGLHPVAMTATIRVRR